MGTTTWTDSVKTTLTQYLNDKENASHFFNKFVYPLITSCNDITFDFRGDMLNDELDICVGGLQWCMFSKDNGIQILPNGKKQAERNAHINGNKSVYAINGWLNGTVDALTTDIYKPYVYVKYPEIDGFDNEISKMLETSLLFIQKI
ncbi:MAG: hypothetical protein RR303_03135 [Bacteroidales bacterium]